MHIFSRKLCLCLKPANCLEAELKKYVVIQFDNIKVVYLLKVKKKKLKHPVSHFSILSGNRFSLSQE